MISRARAWAYACQGEAGQQSEKKVAGGVRQLRPNDRTQMGDAQCFYLRRAEYGVYSQALTCPELPKKATDRSRRSSQLAASVCHRQADLKYRRLLAAIGYRIVQIPVPTARAPLALVPAMARPKRNA